MDSLELLNYMPTYYDGVYEMEELLKAQGRALSQNDMIQSKLLANEFVSTADETGISVMESELGITPLSDESLEDRRREVTLKTNPPQPITLKYLQFLTSNILGLRTRVIPDYAQRQLTVQTTNDNVSEYQVNTITRLLNRLLPANLVYKIDILFVEQTTAAQLYGSVGTLIRASGTVLADTTQQI